MYGITVKKLNPCAALCGIQNIHEKHGFNFFTAISCLKDYDLVSGFSLAGSCSACQGMKNYTP